MDPTKSEMSLAEMDYKGAFSKGRISFLVPLVLDVCVFRTSVSLKKEGITQIWLCLLYSNNWYFEHVTALQCQDHKTGMCSWQGVLSWQATLCTWACTKAQLLLWEVCGSNRGSLVELFVLSSLMPFGEFNLPISSGQILYGRVLWNPEQNLNAAYKLQLEKVYLCTGKDGYVPFFDPTGTVYNEGPQYGCIQPNKHLKHRFLLLVSFLLWTKR